MKMHAAGTWGVAGLAMALAAGCATTSFTSTWKAPGTAPVAMVGKRVAAMVLSPNEGTRRAAEETLAREITARGAQGVPSYTLVDSKNFKDQDAAKAAMAKASIDGVVVMRAVGTSKELTYTPGTMYASPYYGSFWGGGYYGYGWGSVYDPGYLRTDTIVSVETLVYSLTEDKLIWAGSSETINPTRVDSFVTELSGKVAEQMRKEGVLQ